MTRSFVKLGREMLQSSVMKDPHLLQVMIYCLLSANHREEWQTTQVGRGSTPVKLRPRQLIWGRNAVGQKLGQPPKTCEDRLRRLERLGYLRIEAAHHYSIVTLCDLEVWQSEVGTDRQAIARQSPTKGGNPAKQFATPSARHFDKEFEANSEDHDDSDRQANRQANRQTPPNTLPDSRHRTRRQEVEATSAAIASNGSELPFESSTKDDPARADRRSVKRTERIRFDHTSEILHGVTQSDIDEWSIAYPAIEVTGEIMRAKQWLIDNPKNRKSNVARFLSSWMNRAQERAGRVNWGGTHELPPMVGD